MIIDAALDGPFEVVGQLAREHGLEDSSGLRRAFIGALGYHDYERAARLIPVDGATMRQLRELCVKEWGEPVLGRDKP